NWVDPDVDVGSIDFVVAPHREAPSYTATLTIPQLRYNDLPLILSGFFGVGVTTYWDQLSDGIIESFEVTWPEGKGAATGSITWRFGAAHGSGFSDFTDSPTVPAALAVDPNEVIVYGKGLGLYIASDAYDVNYSGSLV